MAPPGPKGGCNSRKTGDLRTRKTQGPLSLSPPLSDVPPPLATPTQHTPSLSLATSPAAAWTSFVPTTSVWAPRSPLSHQPGRAGQDTLPTPGPSLLAWLGSFVPGLGKWARQSSQDQDGGTCGHWTDTTALLSVKRHDYTPCLCHAKSQQQRSSGEHGAARPRDTGAPWRRRRPQEEIMGLGTPEWE